MGMGFSLKNNFRKVQYAAISTVIVSLTLGCSLPEDESKIVLTPTKYEAIEKAQWNELQNINEDSFQVDRYVHYEFNIKDNLSSGFYKFADQYREIIDVALNSDETELKVAMNEYYAEWQGNEIINEKVSNPIWRIPLGKQQISSFGKQILAKTMNSDDEDPPKDDIVYEYFNLKTRSVSLDPPKMVKNKPDCGGLNPCKINGTEIYFILRVTNNGKEVIMAEIKQVISSQVPPLFLFDEDLVYPIVNECWTYMYGKSLATDCKVLRDMQL